MLIELPQVDPFVGDTIRPMLMDARVEAPGGYGWPAPRASVDGGSWWEYAVNGMTTADPHHHKMLRAFAARVRGGARIIVYVWDEPQLLGPSHVLAPFSDGATFDDGSMFVGGTVEAALVDAVALRDDEATISVSSGHTLTGGEFFSLNRSGKGPELHLIQTAESLGGNRWKVQVAPQFRQAHDAGAEVNFNRPAFTAVVQDPSTLWPEYGVNMLGRGSAVFVEAP